VVQVGPGTTTSPDGRRNRSIVVGEKVGGIEAERPGHRGSPMAGRLHGHYPLFHPGQSPTAEVRGSIMKLDDATRTSLESAVFRRLVEHLRAHTEVQNIDLMNLAGFCRNCLSNWMKEAADAKGVAMTKDESREIVYGMPYEEWKAKYQREASADQRAAFDAASGKH
jgi:hypothetical protein